MIVARSIALLLILVGVLIMTTAILTQNESGASDQQETWENPTARYISTIVSEQNKYKIPTTSNNTYDTLPVFIFATNDTAYDLLNTRPSNSIDSLHTYLSGESSNNQNPEPVLNLLNFDTDSKQTAIGFETNLNNELYSYGNAAGNIVKTLEENQQATILALDTFTTSPTDTNAAPLNIFAEKLHKTARDLLAIPLIPSSAKSTNESLASGYEATANALETLASVRDETKIIDAVFAYNDTVEKLGTAYVRVVLLFSSFGISFSPSDSGYTFMFTGAQ